MKVSCLVYSKIPTVAVSLGEILTRHRFYPLETLIELNLSLSQFKPVVTRSFSNRVLRLAREADLPQIMNIAGSAFKTDRLHLDPHLAPEKADQRYMQWVRRALINGEQIYVYEEITSGKLLGFMHIRNISSRIVNLSLASVNPFHKSIGAGILTFQGVLKQLRSQGYQIATTKCSINNLDILNLLISLRFRFSHAVQTFHWFQAGK